MDLVPYKTCSFDCVYCQLGRTADKTVERKEYIPAGVILSQLEQTLSSGLTIDYITLSGSGEPTLNSGIGELMKEIKGMTSIPVTVLTNGSLLYDKELRRDLLTADLLLPSLDAVRKETFELVNRPHPSLAIEEVVRGLSQFRNEFHGEIWLEVMLVKGLNDSVTDIEGLKKAVAHIKPDRVQLNTVARPPSEEFAHPLDMAELRVKRDLLGRNCEIIAEFKERKQAAYSRDTEGAIVELIRRRPVTLQDISISLGIHRNEAIKYLEILEKNGTMKVHEFRGLKYYEYK